MGLSPGAVTRRLAARLVAQALKQRQTLDQVFASSGDLAALEARDVGFVRAMVTGTFRELGRFDHALSAWLERDASTLDPMVLALLRIGAMQLWRLDQPPHAAVAETVSAARADPASVRAAGLVNAVLRRASEDRSGFDAAPVEAVWPDWLGALLVQSLGSEGARRLAQAQLALPQLHLTALDPAGTASALGGMLLETGSVALAMGRIEDVEGYATGEWWVQDTAAALPARLLGVQAGESVLDLCAAPGGKTLKLAATGARVTALDRSAARLERLAENLARTGFEDRVEVVCADALDYRPDQRFDAILLDAPCSALGTLARHPEGAWIKRPGDLLGFPPLQASLLEAALGLLAPGGRLVYCVCTPLQREGRDVVRAACAAGLAARLPVQSGEVRGFGDALTAEGDVLTLPAPGRQHDSFFIARLAKAAG